MLCIPNFKCTCSMVSIIIEIFLSDYCYLLSFPAFQDEEALYVFISVFLSFWYKILTLFPSQELFKNKAKVNSTILKMSSHLEPDSFKSIFKINRIRKKTKIYREIEKILQCIHMHLLSISPIIDILYYYGTNIS